MSFNELLVSCIKLKKKFAYINDIKKKKDIIFTLNKIFPEYYSATIFGIKLLFRYGFDYTANLISNLFRSGIKTLISLPIFGEIININLIKFIIEIGFDGVIVDPKLIHDKKIFSFLRSEEIGILCYGYIDKAVFINKYFKKYLKNIDFDGIFTINVSNEEVKELRQFNKPVINKGKIFTDINVEEIK